MNRVYVDQKPTVSCDLAGRCATSSKAKLVCDEGTVAFVVADLLQAGVDCSYFRIFTQMPRVCGEFCMIGVESAIDLSFTILDSAKSPQFNDLSRFVTAI